MFKYHRTLPPSERNGFVRGVLISRLFEAVCLFLYVPVTSSIHLSISPFSFCKIPLSLSLSLSLSLGGAFSCLYVAHGFPCIDMHMHICGCYLEDVVGNRSQGLAEASKHAYQDVHHQTR